MRAWQFIVVLVLSASAVWLVISYPAHPRTIEYALESPARVTETPKAASKSVSLMFAGDVMLSRSVGDTMLRLGNWNWPFANIASQTSVPDVMFVNLETPISLRGVAGGCGYCFRTDPRAIQGLVFAGIDVVSLANNHAWDYGLPALEDTLSYLAANDVSVAGAGRTLTEARGPVIRTVNGTRIAYLAYTDLLPVSAAATDVRAGVNEFDEGRMIEDISRARPQADVVIVSFHTGTEYETMHNTKQQHVYHAAIDAGADLVVGHHPHVVQDIERYNGKWIAYSLGNFIFDQNFSLATRMGMILDVTVTDGSIVNVATRSVDISKQYQASMSK